MTDSTSPVPIEELLAHAAWVQRLARRLVRDDATAMDVVQQTWYAGLRSPPTDRARVRGWLARVVRNFAHDAYRTRTSREAREARVARRESVTLPPEGLLERAEATRDVAAAVTRLPEPYRSTILRRYFQGLSAQEIADQEGVPVETVRTRIKRGVDMLRADLRKSGGEEWALGLVPLCGRGGAPSPSRLVRHARRARTTRVAVFATAAAVVVAAAWIATRGAASTEQPTRDAAAAAPRPSPPADDPVRRPGTKSAVEGAPVSATTAQPATASESTKPAQASPAATVAVQVVLAAADGAPAVPVRVVATPLRVGGPRSREWAKTFDVGAAGGAIDLPRTSPIGTVLEAWDLRVEHPDLVPLHTTVDVPAEPSAKPPTCTLPLTPAGVVVGFVRAPLPLTECAPWIAAFTDDAAAPKVVDQSAVAADGGYRLRLPPGVKHRIVVAALGARPARFDVAVPVREIRRAEPVALDVGGAIVGSFENFDGRPGAGAHVSVGGMSDGRSATLGPYTVTIGATDVDWDSLQTTTDAAGRFRVAGLAPVKYRVSVAENGLASDRLNALARDVIPGGGEERFVTTAGAVEVRVLRDGEPLAGAELSVSGLLLKADESGRARLLGEPGAKYELRLRAAAPKGAPPALKLVVTAPELGSTRVEPFETKSSTPPARLVVTLRGDKPPVAAGIALYAQDGDFPERPEVLRDVPCNDGVVRLDGLPAGRFRVVVRPGGTWSDSGTFFVEQSASVELGAGAEAATELPLEAAGRLSLGARTPDGKWAAARCTVRAESGEVVHVRAPRREAAWSGEMQDVLSPSGAVVLSPALRPGSYSVACTLDGAADVGEKRVVVRAGHVAEEIVDLAPR